MNKTLDMLGQPCPIPVVQAKKTLAQPDSDTVDVLVDNLIATQNLEKMATGLGYGFACVQEDATRWRTTITKSGDFSGQLAKAPEPGIPLGPLGGVYASMPHAGAVGPTVLITGEGLGRGSDELGKMLVKGFIFSLTELNPPPKAVIFLNGGAHLTTAGANTVDDLHTLAAKGTEVLTCGTCANYYQLADKLAVGEITDMMGITARLAAAAHLITL